MQNNLLNMAINKIKYEANKYLEKNPQAIELFNSLKGKSESELKQYAENVAKGKNIDISDCNNAEQIIMKVAQNKFGFPPIWARQ